LGKGKRPEGNGTNKRSNQEKNGPTQNKKPKRWERFKNCQETSTGGGSKRQRNGGKDAHVTHTVDIMAMGPLKRKPGKAGGLTGQQGGNKNRKPKLGGETNTHQNIE